MNKDTAKVDAYLKDKGQRLATSVTWRVDGGYRENSLHLIQRADPETAILVLNHGIQLPSCTEQTMTVMLDLYALRALADEINAFTNELEAQARKEEQPWTKRPIR